MKWLILIMFLTGCIGPELIAIGKVKVTAGTAITVPAKIEAYEKYKEEKKQEEYKKRFEINKLEERKFEIYY